MVVSCSLSFPRISFNVLSIYFQHHFHKGELNRNRTKSRYDSIFNWLQSKIIADRQTESHTPNLKMLSHLKHVGEGIFRNGLVIWNNQRDWSWLFSC